MATAITPGQMAAGLTARLDGPHADEDTAAAARLAAEAVRFLNYATAGGTGLTYPATACTVAGELASAAARLHQLSGQLGRFLAAELAAGRLGDDSGDDPAENASRAADFLVAAGVAADTLAATFGAAQSCMASLHGSYGPDDEAMS
jgi:hypothetical protein